MKRWLQGIYSLLVTFGIDPRKTLYSVKGLPGYFWDFWQLKSQKSSIERVFHFGRLYPCLGERYAESGAAKGHYFHQDLLVARRIYANNPRTHVDVGSRVDGFVAHIASFRQIHVIDIRPLPTAIPNVRFMQADLMETDVAVDLIDYCDSLSCLHAIEHFGLGRYGDPVNYDGYLLGLSNLQRILKRSGKLYFSVPIGPQRIEFNAHRIFSVNYLLQYFDGKYQIDSFSFVDDQGDLHENTPITTSGIKSNFGCLYGCGIFEMTKL
jgi:SAM-dependent methyltransferase